MSLHPDIFISSTSKDLEEHREAAIHVCQRLGLPPVAMENFTPEKSGAVEYCRERVLKSEAFLGIYAYRYGWQPEGYAGRSITELEYEWALEAGIPILIWIVDERIPWIPENIEIGESAQKLRNFKQRLMSKHVVRKFSDNVQSFREDLFVHLPQVREQVKIYNNSSSDKTYYLRHILQPPQPYIAHPYSLMSSTNLAGRKEELKLLTGWLTKTSEEFYQTRVLNIVAIGGMGKSALTWHWFNKIVPHAEKAPVGRIWWSFYESNAHFDNFIIRSLAYVTGRSHEDIQNNISQDDHESMLLQFLDKKFFLIAMDGIERLLIAYARLDAARLEDSEFDQQTANFVATSERTSTDLAQSFADKSKLRRTLDPRVGNFLRKLTRLNASKILITTRLYPASLQDNFTSEPIHGSAALFLQGLSDDDALELWRMQGINGRKEKILGILNRFENYPLLIRALAGSIRDYRRAPRDFEKWYSDNEDFGLDQLATNLPLVQVKSHVLAHSLNALSDQLRRAIDTMAVFRSPISYETLYALFIVDENPLCETEESLDQILAELENRGLIGWDRLSNCYDLHPIVRNVLWGRISNDNQNLIYEQVADYFASISTNQDIQSMDQLIPSIELFDKLIALERFGEAYRVFRDRLDKPTFYRFDAHETRRELLECFFQNGVEFQSNPGDLETNRWLLHELATSYQKTGEPGRTLPIYEKLDQLEQSIISRGVIRISGPSVIRLCHQASANYYTGNLLSGYKISEHALFGSTDHRDGASAAHGLETLAEILLTTNSNLAKIVVTRLQDFDTSSSSKVYSSMIALRQNDRILAEKYASIAWDKAEKSTSSWLVAEAALVNARVSLSKHKFEDAEKWLQVALENAQSKKNTSIEIPIIVELARLEFTQGRLSSAQDWLDNVWEAVVNGPYPIYHADALNLQVEIELKHTNIERAIEVATKAYELSWCDGISKEGTVCFAYWAGLNTARKHLLNLNNPIPQLPTVVSMSDVTITARMIKNKIHLWYPDNSQPHMEGGLPE